MLPLKRIGGMPKHTAANLFCFSVFSVYVLTLYSTKSNTTNDELGKAEVYDDNR